MAVHAPRRRHFLSLFLLPGESQKISRIIEAFALHYHAVNPQPSTGTRYSIIFRTMATISS